MIGGSPDVAKAVVDRIQFECSIAAIVLKKLHHTACTEKAFIEEITDNFYCGKPHVSTANDPAVDKLTSTAGIKHDLAARASLTPLDLLIKVIVWET